jgi:HEAT repeat protein
MKSASLFSFLILSILFVPAFRAAAADDGAEAKWLAVLNSGADWQEKQQACRELRVVGTIQSLPELAALLTDPQLAGYARFAMEEMRYPEVDALLHDALTKTTGAQQAGIVITMGARRDASAVSLIAPLLESPDADLARAAAGALGRIATAESVDVLMQFRTKAPEAARFPAEEGLLAAAERWIAEKKGDQAAPVLEVLIAPGAPANVRMGAFYLLAAAQPDKAPDRLLAALAGEDADLRSMAARVISETKGADLTARYAAALPTLSTDGQVALLRALAGRGDAAAHPTVVQAIDNPEKTVKVAAIKTLATLGNADDVARLAALMEDADADIAATSRATLATIEGTAVDAAIKTAIGLSPATVQAKLIDLLLDRRAEQALPTAVAYVLNRDVPVREAALRILAVLGTKENTSILITAIDTAPDAAARGAAENALGSLCARCGDEALPTVINAMGCSRIDSRMALLRAVGRAGGAKALDCVVLSLNDNDETFRNEALRELSDWPTADAAPQLLELAKSDQENRHVLGLRGYIRLARAVTVPADKATMLIAAMDLTRQPEEKWQVLAAWGTLKSAQSLDALLPFLQDTQVKNEAGSAVITVSAELAKAGGEAKTRAVDALKAVIAACDNQAVLESANRVLATLG